MEANPMKLLTVSDSIAPILFDRFERSNFPDVDLILSCGDLPSEYLTFLVTMFNVPLFYVRGNHDGGYDASPPQGCVDLHTRIVTHKGIRFFGLEGSRWYNGGAHQYTEQQMRRLVRKLGWQMFWRGNIDVVITHAPPRGIHDAEDPCHRGFKSFHRIIDRYNPQYFIHGHIHSHFDHPNERITMTGQTRVINTFGYCEIELDHEEKDS